LFGFHQEGLTFDSVSYSRRIAIYKSDASLSFANLGCYEINPIGATDGLATLSIGLISGLFDIVVEAGTTIHTPYTLSIAAAAGDILESETASID